MEGAGGGEVLIGGGVFMKTTYMISNITKILVWLLAKLVID